MDKGHVAAAGFALMFLLMAVRVPIGIAMVFQVSSDSV